MVQNIFHKFEFESLRVLIVDDDPGILSIISMFLHTMGIRKIKCAENGEAALEFFRSDPRGVDFIICDWVMPKINGLELFAHVRKLNPDIPFIMLTGKSTADEVRTAVEAGVCHYIAKPFTQDTLQKKVLPIAKDILVSQKGYFD